MTESKTNLPVAPVACVVLAAGQGTRMKSDLPKILHPVASMPMIGHVLNACADLGAEKVVVVIAPNSKAIEAAVLPHRCVVQPRALGTGDAVRAALLELKNFKGDVIVLFGDTPLVTAGSLLGLQKKRDETRAAIVVAGFSQADGAGYGRLITDKKGSLLRIVEAADANDEERAVKLCNGGVMLFAGEVLAELVGQLRDDNVKKEFYLTDCIGLAVKAGMNCAVAEMPCEEVLGVNSRVELAQAEKLMQQRLRRKVMLEGATLVDPDSVFLSVDTKIGRDAVIEPQVFFGPGVDVGARVRIRAFSHLEQVKVEEEAIIGPYSRLRPGTVVGAGAHIGNFVELKNAEVGKGAKINHLSYIGDAFVGSKANIGAGTITCNYDGFRKQHTHIGAETFIGSNSALVAPVKIGDGAYVGAGSVITMEVPAGTLAVARGRQANIEDWAKRFREEQKNAKKD